MAIRAPDGANKPNLSLLVKPSCCKICPKKTITDSSTRCHQTFVTQYESQQEEECEENFRKSCFIEYEKIAFNETVESWKNIFLQYFWNISIHLRQECVGSHWSKTATEGGMRSAGLDFYQHLITLFKAKHAGHLFSFQDRVRVWVLDEAGGARCTRRCGGMSDGGGAEYFSNFRQIIFSNSTLTSTNKQ